MSGQHYQHDPDAELGTFCAGDLAASGEELLARLPPRRGDLAYWVETGNLVREYLVLQAGAAYSETLRQGFVTWLRRSPGERRRRYSCH